MDKNNEETDLQTILNRLLPTNQGVDLSELKATSAELNILSGISSNVTTANLNTLTGGNVTALHSHTGTITDAATLDSLDSTQFLRSDTDDTFEGTALTIDGDVCLASGGTISTTSNGDVTVNPNGSGNILLGISGNQTIVQIQGDLSVSGDVFSGTILSFQEKMRAFQQGLSSASQSQITKSLQEFEETISQTRKRVALLEEAYKTSARDNKKDENRQTAYSSFLRESLKGESFEENLFERGESQLNNGEATILLSAPFLERTEIDEDHPLFVKTTLLSSDCHELAVVERSLFYFRVKELYQGTSQCPFLWEASAKKRSRPKKKRD